MNIVLGTADDARKTNKTGVWMIVTREDFKLGSTLHSETYKLLLVDVKVP